MKFFAMPLKAESIFSFSGLFLVALALLPSLAGCDSTIASPVSAAPASAAPASAAPASAAPASAAPASAAPASAAPTAAPPSTAAPTTAAPTPEPTTVIPTTLPPVLDVNPKRIFDTNAPLTSIFGYFALDSQDFESYRPSWASVWKIDDTHDVNNGEFHIAFWPPKYCQAVYVCMPSKKDYNPSSHFETEKGLCSDSYIKFYPHAKKFVLKAGSAQTEDVEKFWMSNRLIFDLNEQFEAELHVLDAEPTNYKTWQSESDNKTRFKFNLKDKDLLVLTNSRMCQVNKIGSNFYPLFGLEITASTSGVFPEWLNDGEKYVRTDSLPSLQKTGLGKTVDLLDFVTKLKWSNGNVGKLTRTCDQKRIQTSGRTEKPNSLFRKVSAQSYDVNVPNRNWNAKSERKFTLSVQKCHWFRLWATHPDTKIEEYKDKMKLGETLDVFLNEGFYLTPESNEAHPLPDVYELTKFTIKAQRDDTGDYDDLVEMSYGEMQGRRIYREFFNIPWLKETHFKVHIIKAPGCELGIDGDTQTWSDYDTGRPNQMWDINSCEYSFFQ
ncbi:unnamed protein product [Caenorhabditis sp. 36 PRJEB53466]|nr:unnamed protein product [Caenorhabditis sp. 36 PRJEB53466]